MVRAQLCPTLCDPQGPWPTRFLCSWNFPCKNTGVGCHFLFQSIFLTPGTEPVSPALAGDSSPLRYPGSRKTSTPTNALSSMGVSPEQPSPGSHWRRLRGAGGSSQLIPRSVCPMPDAQVRETSWASWQMMVGPTTPTETLLFTEGCQTITIKRVHRKEGYLLHPWYWPHT